MPIILAATPIGNLGDASPRLREILASADIIAAEDTRNTLQLLRLLEVTAQGQLVSMHDHNERDKVTQLLAAARHGKTVVVVSDAGMPTVSDPGYHLVAAARHEALGARAASGSTDDVMSGAPEAAGSGTGLRDGNEPSVEVLSVPGPSAVLTALAVSGLPTDRFSFEGFVPRKAGEQRKTFAALQTESRTMVFFESPNRLAATLAAMAEAFGSDRQASVSRELTKKFEHTEWGTLSQLAEWASDGVRGEIVIVVGGKPAVDRPADMSALVSEVQVLVSSGLRLKEATAMIAERENVSRKTLYDLALKAK